MKTIIIISGHGYYATGLKSTIELIAGPTPDIYYLDLTIKDSDIILKEKMQTVIKENMQSNVLLVCDILGGTPFKVSAQIANKCKNMEVVAGCNIGSILEGVFKKDTMTVAALAEVIVEFSQKTTIWLEKCKGDEMSRKIDAEDGI
jgi:PTS system N-acetylgalactosamine-specific IIA component